MKDEAPKQDTVTLVWRGPGNMTAEHFKSIKGLHARQLTPADNGVSREYLFGFDNDHTLAVSAADAAIIMDGPDAKEFRVKG